MAMAELHHPTMSMVQSLLTEEIIAGLLLLDIQPTALPMIDQA